MMVTQASREFYVDPRVLRTRHMLERALEGLLLQKEFDSISVSDIADASTLNRATFYAHFDDKFALLGSLVTTRFEHLLQARNVAFDGTCISALYSIVLAVCDFLVDIPYCSEQRNLAQHLELSMVAVVRKMVTEGASRRPPRSGTDPALVAAAVAGGIYASAKQWLHTEDRSAADIAAQTITTLLTPLLA